MRNARVLCGVLVLASAWAASAWAASAWAASAWAAGASSSSVASCRRITDDKQRLACFDRESALEQQPVRGAGATTQGAGVSTQAARAKPAASTPGSPKLTPEERMGLTPDRILKLQGSAETRELKELTAKVRAVSGDPGARRYFTLENGQVWRQIEADPQFTVRPGDSVRITKALFGSYFLSVNRHMSTRVSRAR